MLLRVLACGVCRTDLHILEGELPPHRSPVVPGHQIVGEVVALGAGAELVAPGGEPGAPPLAVGDRVGVPWLHQTDETCRFCRRGDENLCEHALFTGWDVDGGFAEYTVAPAGFVYRLPAGMTAMAAAPLLCAGIIGYRCLRSWHRRRRRWAARAPGLGGGLRPPAERRQGARALARLAAYAARRPTARAASPSTVSARPPRCAPRSPSGAAGRCTASPATRSTAPWPASSARSGPARAATTPACSTTRPSSSRRPASWPSKPCAVSTRGGIVALGGIYSSPIPPIEYPWIYHERVVRSVANSTRRDARELLRDAALIPVVSRVQEYDLEQANEALLDLKEDRVRGSAVLGVAED